MSEHEQAAEKTGATAQHEGGGSNASTVAAVSGLMGSTDEGLFTLVQARLQVSNPDDPFEHEAEAAADDFVRSVHRRSAPRAMRASTGIARSTDSDGLVSTGGGLATTDDTASAIDAARGGGIQMSEGVRSRFESFFGSDLSGVRVHADEGSDRLCRSIEAEAFTAGRDVFFTRGSFAPGSAKGDHLLAHELTHVVQQGQAPAITRRATTDVMRWGAKRDPKKEELDPTASTGALVATVGGAVSGVGGGVKSAVTSGMEKAGNAVNTGAADISGGALGIFDSTTKLFNSLWSLMSNWKAQSTDSVIDNGIEGVKASIEISTNAVKIATAAGAGVAAGAIPGLGLAVNVIDLAKQIMRIADMWKANSRATSKLDEFSARAAKKEALTDEEQRLQATLERLRSDARHEFGRSILRAAGDIVGIAGQIATVAGGIGGGAILAGMILQGSAALWKTVQEWAEATAVRQARAAHQLDPENKKLQIERLKVDSYFAAQNLINYTVGTLDAETKKFDPSAVALITPFGINEAWLTAYAADPKPATLEIGTRIICDKLGKDPDPLTLFESIKGAYNKVAAFFGATPSGGKSYFVDNEDIVARTSALVIPTINTYFADKMKRGTDVKADSLTGYLATSYKMLTNLAAKKPPKGEAGLSNKDASMKVVDSTIEDQIKAKQPQRVKVDTIKVAGGKVSWQYEGDQKMKTKGFFSGLFGKDKYQKV